MTSELRPIGLGNWLVEEPVMVSRINPPIPKAHREADVWIFVTEGNRLKLVVPVVDVSEISRVVSICRSLNRICEPGSYVIGIRHWSI